MLVVRPTVVYEGFRNSHLVWRTGLNCSMRFRPPRDYLANQNGLETGLPSCPSPDHNAKEPRNG